MTWFDKFWQYINSLPTHTPLPTTYAPLKPEHLPPHFDLPPKPPASDDDKHDLGHRVRRTMLKLYPSSWLPSKDDLNVVTIERMNPDGSPCDTGPNSFDDIKMVLDGEGNIVGGPWEATSHPGRYWTLHPMAEGGAFIIAKGPQSCWTFGDYHGPAWRQAEDSTILGHRDPNATFRRRGEPVKHGYIGVHHHKGYNLPKGDIKNAAAGCQVIRSNDDQEEFCDITTRKNRRYQADRKGYRLTATVIDRDDLLP